MRATAGRAEAAEDAENGGPGGAVAGGVAAVEVDDASDKDAPLITETSLPPQAARCPPYSQRVSDLNDIRGIYACFKRNTRCHYLCHTKQSKPGWAPSSIVPDSFKYGFLHLKKSVAIEEIVHESPRRGSKRDVAVELQKLLPQGWTPVNYYGAMPAEESQASSQ